MLAIASQIILCLVLAALLGLIIGYLLGKGNCPKAAYKAVTPVDPHTHDDEACEEETPTSDTSDEPEESEATDEAAPTEAEGLLSHPDAHESSETVLSTDAATEAEPVADTEKETVSTQAETKTPIEEKQEAKPPKAAKTEKATAQDEAVPDDADKPSGLLDAPRNGEKDNLTRIKGIGVKIEELLNGIGVYHFDQIAAWSDKEAYWIDHQVSFPGRALRDDWIGQAKLLAEGKETEFSKRVDAGEVSSSKASSN